MRRGDLEANLAFTLGPIALAFVATLAAMILIPCCGPPSNDRVESEFQKLHPDVEVLDVGPGEGDGDHVYMIIDYRLPGDGRTRRCEWLYRNDGIDGWNLAPFSICPRD
jgi:hypothetical protein